MKSTEAVQQGSKSLPRISVRESKSRAKHSVNNSVLSRREPLEPDCRPSRDWPTNSSSTRALLKAHASPPEHSMAKQDLSVAMPQSWAIHIQAKSSAETTGLGGSPKITSSPQCATA